MWASLLNTTLPISSIDRIVYTFLTPLFFLFPCMALLITSYVHPDLDGTACGVAYAELLTTLGYPSEAGFFGGFHPEAEHLFTRFSLPAPRLLHDEELEDFTGIVLVDASDLVGLEGHIAPERVIEIIDHRSIHQAELFPHAQVQIEMVGAAATLIVEKFMKQGTAPSFGASILLAGAILSNTLNFQGTLTTERDHEAYAWLLSQHDFPSDFVDQLFLSKSDLRGSRLQERLDNELATFTFGETHCGIAQLEIIGALPLLFSRLLDIQTHLEAIKEREHLSFLFLNLIDLKEGKNYFVPCGAEERTFLIQKAGATFFIPEWGIRSPLIMRKQLSPLVKAHLS